MYHYLLCFFVAHHAATSASVLQSVGHLPLLALEPLLHLQHHQCADPCTVSLNTLVLARGATFLNLAAVSVPDASDNHLLHSFNPSIQFFNPSIL